ncbi:cyclin-D3-3-like [Andrographis paniculata]|uniref:cyclin-D3-3-like n=1 Tax=Andrographis paniculata TaxID=175694 RepID=UPI0021E8E8D4|nr:cyclin-D3-3-like [Andrographis paniculata]
MLEEIWRLSSTKMMMSSYFKNPIFDALYCDERNFDEVFCDGIVSEVPKISDFDEIGKRDLPLGHDLFWEDDEVVSLLHMEQKIGVLNYDDLLYSKMVRDEGIEWILKGVEHYGFKPLTGVLAVNYLDRFVTSLCFRTEKPWMGQLASVACLSIAAKVEETQAPLLLDIQVVESKYFFEAKTVQRMELLVLSTLQWRMHPVTPFSFLDHIVRRFDLITNLDREFPRRCESIFLAAVTDCPIAHHRPSIIAAATMMYVIQEIDSCDGKGFRGRIMDVLRVDEGEIADCHKLIVDLIEDQTRKQILHKRKHAGSIPGSPSGVIDAFFSSDSSNESWSNAPSVSSSPEPMAKRGRGD